MKTLKKIKNSYAVKNYRKIARYVKPYWLRALLALLVTVPVGMIDTVIPWALKNYIDALAIGNKSIINSYMPLLILMFALIQSVLTYIATYLNSWVGAKISNGLKYDLFLKLMRYDAAFFDHNASGAIQARFNNDVDIACGGLLNHLKMFSIRIFNSVSLIIALFVISWRLAIVALIILMIALFPLTKIRNRIMGIASETVFSGAAIATHYIEAFAGNKIVTSYNLYDYQKHKITNALDYAFKLGMKMVQRTGILSPMMHLVVGVGVAVIIWMGSSLISQNLLTSGGFVAFVTAVIMLYQPIKTMGNDFNSVQMSLIAIERVFSLLHESPGIVNRKNAVPLKNIMERIEFRDVCFAYDGDKFVLEQINLTIKVGQTVALVGNSGGGKTTLLNLLPRFYEVTSGKILIDGYDIRDLELDSLRSKIAVVFQDNFLFSGTIRENILMGKRDATRTEIERAVTSACLEEFVGKLGKGLNTEIGERGVLLSGGQKQRVAIARAFLKNAPVVILDEATSALDNRSEAVVQQAIDNLMKDRTVFIIAHRLSTVQHADRILVVNHGRIVESGTHGELVGQKGGVYYSLYNANQQK
ncbi:MAG: ABC transporter ATP-binding protein/permease [Holosporaceae bacterium]|jgi:subfamily B ATP-binding cassette protein MsbA|nr:ABC transporter ATP-binding protein/permease [Holosporaceae bacterium]